MLHLQLFTLHGRGEASAVMAHDFTQGSEEFPLRSHPWKNTYELTIMLNYNWQGSVP
jgi:hypothetical protein